MKRILIVDDNSQDRDMLEALLKGYHFDVKSAGNGTQALLLAREEPPDMIISDIMMPVMDGFALCREWKMDEKLKTIPFIFYTATYTSAKEEEFAFKLGADRFIIKPQEPEVFLKKLLEVIKEEHEGLLAVSEPPLGEEMEFFGQYNQVLFQKLEMKIIQLHTEIIDRKRAQEALRESEQRYRLLFDNMTSGFQLNEVIIDEHNNPCDFRILDGNCHMKSYTGFSIEQAKGKTIKEIMPNADIEMIRKYGNVAISGEAFTMEYFSHTFNKHFRVNAYSPQKGQFAVIYEDITERKLAQVELEERSKRYHALFEQAGDGIFMLDTNGKILSVNETFARMHGLSTEEILQNGLDKLDVEGMDKMPERMQRILAGETLSFEVEHYHKDGHIFPLLVMANLISTVNERFIIAIHRDLTERKQAEEKIKASLQEKELLLREIHHRVKNNMQIISSMLNLQIEYIKDKNITDLFSESQNRILSMALVHEKLYQSSDLRNINFKEYINDLGANLLQLYNYNNVTLNTAVEDISLDIDLAIPAGLIINELITNSLKYAFPDGMKGEISISFRSIHENMLELVVSDNGIGLAKDLDIRKGTTLGLHLVTSLAENQLNGKIDINREKGTEFQIRFKGKK